MPRYAAATPATYYATAPLLDFHVDIGHAFAMPLAISYAAIAFTLR